MIEILELRLGDERYAVPLARVIEVAPRVALTELPGVASPIAGCIDYRGTPIPVIDLRARLERPARPGSLTDHLVIARTDRRPVALLVDRAVGVAAIDPDAVAAAPESARVVGGVVRLEGGLLLVVDLDELLDLEQDRALTAALAETVGGR